MLLFFDSKKSPKEEKEINTEDGLRPLKIESIIND